MPYLVIKTRDGRTNVELKSRRTRIGGARSNTITLNLADISPKHCEVELTKKNGVVLRDLGSDTGTLLGGQKIEEAPLQDGDEFQVAGVKFLFLEHEPAKIDADQKPNELNIPGVEGLTLGSVHDLLSIGQDLGFGINAIETVNTRGEVTHQAGGGDGIDSVTLLLMMLLGAMRAGASDLHVEPGRGGGTVRMRIDGTMIDMLRLTPELSQRLVGVVKVLCDADITQKNMVQEGHFSCNAPGRRADYRVSFTPSMHGQNLVIRVLDPYNAPQRLEKMGFATHMRKQISELIHRDTGMLLTTGPTGSGKTTTLYAALREINADKRNLVSIENPVEYELPGVTQIPVNAEEGKTFAALLKSVLRQDPDVIVVGEIRDKETAVTAMQAANTGHMVMSTVHTKDAIGAVYRLLDLGVEPFLIASALEVVLAQRLVRKLCKHCRQPMKPTAKQQQILNKLGLKMDSVLTPVGCERCLGTGYISRTAVWEMLQINDAIRDLILSGRPTLTQLRDAAKGSGYVSLQRFGVELVKTGRTTVEEIERAVGFSA